MSDIVESLERAKAGLEMAAVAWRARGGKWVVEGNALDAIGQTIAHGMTEITRLRAEAERKDAALRAIADQSGCGCKPVCHCNDNVGALLIFKEWAVETARAALTAQEKTDDKA